MATDNGADIIQEQVECDLPTLLARSEEDLLADVGNMALVLDGEVFFFPPPRQELIDRGRALSQNVRHVICDAANKDLITTSLDAANLTNVIVLLAPVLGFPSTAIPVGVISLVVFIMKIGLNRYCLGYRPPAE